MSMCLGVSPPLPYSLAESRVCELSQTGYHEPPGEEETGLHPRADGDRGEIRGRPADRPGGNSKIQRFLYVTYTYRICSEMFVGHSPVLSVLKIMKYNTIE